jgi:hypothetical protein
MIAPSMTDHGHRNATMRVDGDVGTSIAFVPVPNAVHLYYGTFPSGAGSAVALLGRLRAGSRAQLLFETGYAMHVYSSGLAGSSAAIGEAERLCRPQAVTSPAEAVASFVVDQVCEGRGGQMNPRNIFEADLDQNGRRDVIIDEMGISCNGSATWQRRSLSCGAQVCGFQVFLDLNGTFTQSFEGHGMVTGVGTAQAPIIDTAAHGGTRIRYRWNGSGFSRF